MTDTTPIRPQTIFQIGIHKVVADETTAALSVEEARQFLKNTYPEVIHATATERVVDGQRIVVYTPIVGRKG
jgi:hypothetical protein